MVGIHSSEWKWGTPYYKDEDIVSTAWKHAEVHRRTDELLA